MVCENRKVTAQPGRAQRLDASVRLSVAVLTYRRPELLRLLMPLLAEQVEQLRRERPGFSTRVVVVDNDPEASAHEIVRASGLDAVTYVVEPAPGISAARNRALAETANDDVLVFIDDDETPHPGWLTALVTAAQQYGAGAVAGPVVSRFAAEPDPFVTAGGFFERAHRRGLETGTRISRAATNNLLLDLRQIGPLGLRFDERFGFSGGEDSLFTGQLDRAGVPMVWATEAVVTDHVPADRLTRGYVLHRTAALASSGVHSELALLDSTRGRGRLRLRTGVRETARLLLALPVVLRGALTRDLERQARGRRSMARALGAFRGLSGRWPAPYARPSDPPR